MGYEKWETKNLSPLRIQLDSENPRLPGLKDGANQAEVRSELFDTSKIREMIRSIAKSGFFPDQRVVVVKKENGRGYIVVEGNRRVCSCQVLLKPELAPGKHARVVKKWAVSADNYRDSFAKLPVVVAPSRLAAIRLMASRHLNDAPVISWSRYAQGRFAISALSQGQSMGEVIDETGLTESEVKKSIQEARLYELFFGLSWTDEEKGIILDNLDKFPIEVISRILRSTKTHEKFGKVYFDDEGWPIFYWDKETLENTLKRFLYDSHTAFVQDKSKIINSRSLNKISDVEEYLDKLPDEVKPTPTKDGVSAKNLVPDSSTSDLSSTRPQSMAGKPTTKAKPVRRAKKESALPSDMEVGIEHDKAKALVDELQTIIPESMPYATGLLLRALLEISLIAKLRSSQQWKHCVTKYQNGKGDIPSLDNILKFSATNELVIEDPSLRRSLSNQGVVPKILLNLVAHNDTHIFTETEAREVSNKMTPLLRYLLKKKEVAVDETNA